MISRQLTTDARMLEVIVLAAGRGTRMKSELPKVLHHIGGKPMVARVLDTARQLGAERIHVVVGHGASQVADAVAALPSPPLPSPPLQLHGDACAGQARVPQGQGESH